MPDIFRYGEMQGQSYDTIMMNVPGSRRMDLMSLNSFLIYLQQLLTMVDSTNPYSVELAKSALRETFVLARLSEMADGFTLRTMKNALDTFDHLVSSRDQFAGVPGEFQENEKKRRRLGMVLGPRC